MYYITSNDGIKIAVYDYNPQAKEAVFLIHGWPLSHKIFEYQINLLTDRGYRVIAVDLRGFGRSDTPVDGYCYGLFGLFGSFGSLLVPRSYCA